MTMSKTRIVIQWDGQPFHFCKVFCALMETQTLVDFTIISNSHSVKVHKCVLAANSSYFREKLQKDSNIDRVVINGIKHVVLKSLIEFIYSGETTVYEENMNELIAAAKYFDIRGVMAIIPEKMGLQHSEDFDMSQRPPLFFAKSEKVKSIEKRISSSNMNFTDKNCVFMEAPRRGRRNQNQSNTKLSAETEVALAKEEAASRLALEMLKKDIKNSSNLFVIDGSCTEATVQTSIAEHFDSMPISGDVVQEFVLSSDNKCIPIDLTKHNEIDMAALISRMKQDEIKNVPTDENMNSVNQSYLGNSDVSVLYKSSDGSFVNVTTNQVLETFHGGQTISYEVMPTDGTEPFSEYMCNNFSDFSVVNVNDSNLPNSISNDSNYQNKPLSYTELVADAVNPEYNNINGIENHFSGNMDVSLNSTVNSTSDVTEIEETDPFNNLLSPDEEAINYIPNENNLLPKLPVEEEFTIDDYSDVNDDQSDIDMENSLPLKKKRGRPPKRKQENRKMMISPIKNEFVYSDKESSVFKTEIVENQNISNAEQEQIEKYARIIEANQYHQRINASKTEFKVPNIPPPNSKILRTRRRNPFSILKDPITVTETPVDVKEFSVRKRDGDEIIAIKKIKFENIADRKPENSILNHPYSMSLLPFDNRRQTRSATKIGGANEPNYNETTDSYEEDQNEQYNDIVHFNNTDE